VPPPEANPAPEQRRHSAMPSVVQAERMRHVKEMRRKSAQIFEQLSLEEQQANERAEQAQVKAMHAKALAARKEWEQRTLDFLAAGNAVMKDGTPIAMFIKLQKELRDAETSGVPLSEAARTVILQIGGAEKAIRAAGQSAKAAAARAAAEYKLTERGSKMAARASIAGRSSSSRDSSPMLTAAERHAKKLSDEASRLADEAKQKGKEKAEAGEKLKVAERNERVGRWGSIATDWRSRWSESNDVPVAVTPDMPQNPSTKDAKKNGVPSVGFLCSCWPPFASSKARVMPPPSPPLRGSGRAPPSPIHPLLQVAPTGGGRNSAPDDSRPSEVLRRASERSARRSEPRRASAFASSFGVPISQLARRVSSAGKLPVNAVAAGRRATVRFTLPGRDSSGADSEASARRNK